MKRRTLTLVRVAPEAPTEPPVAADAPLVSLRITGRHGVYLLQQGADAAEEAVVDTRHAEAITCTCGAPADGGECRHIAMLRACGFLAEAA
jgi:hypothetical protein